MCVEKGTIDEQNYFSGYSELVYVALANSCTYGEYAFFIE